MEFGFHSLPVAVFFSKPVFKFLKLSNRSLPLKTCFCTTGTEFFTLATKVSFKSSCGSASFFNLFLQFVNHAIKRNLAHDREGEREHRLQSCGDKVHEYCELVHFLCLAHRHEHIIGKVENVAPFGCEGLGKPSHDTSCSRLCLRIEIAVRTSTITDDHGAGLDPCI